jgi:hypothetical protein
MKCPIERGKMLSYRRKNNIIAGIKTLKIQV